MLTAANFGHTIKFMKHNKLLYVLFCLGLCALVSCKWNSHPFDKKSGAYKITGTVTDKVGNPIPDVAISIVDSKIASTTAADGSYTLQGVTGSTVQLVARKAGLLCVPSYEHQGEFASGSFINVASAALRGVVAGANFTAVSSVTISDIQGSGAESPLKDAFVANVIGVVTMVCYKTPHEKYNTILMDGTTGPQWISEDGFFMEALPEHKDVSGKKSNGIFVMTHDDNFEDSKWCTGFPTDLKEGDVVAVNGTVVETRTANRFNNSEGYLPRTGIKAAAVVHVQEGGINKTAAYPDGVLLTYSQSKKDSWLSGHENDGKREARILPFNDDTKKNALQTAIDVLESVECMVVRIDEPIVVGGTYYNLTGVLADDGKNASGERPNAWNNSWSGNVITENDFNPELLFVDYQSPSWTTFQALSQMGDHLKDSTGARVFRGVLDYTDSGLYMARPINPTVSLTSVTGASIPPQGWAFDNDAVWYAGTAVANAMKTQKSSDINGIIKTWRTGTKTAPADPLFTPAWSAQVGDIDTLTLAAFNLENYEAQGGSYNLDKDLARIIKNNMLYPDVIVIVEMGDDVATPITYQNQGNAYAPKDGNVTAVKNYSTIIEAVRANGGPEYEFRQIDPKDQDSGGKQGVNIRVGFMYNTARVDFVDRGLVSNYYANTHSGNVLLPQEQWPVHAWGDGQAGALLAETNTVPYGDGSGAHITQSPGCIQSSYFNKSRRPLVGEFIFKASPSAPTFFVIACHLSSKTSDMPLYGQVQPPLLFSENARSGQARAINDFVKKLLSYDREAKIIVAGDMNDFAYSTPVRVLTGEAGGNRVLWSPAEEFMPVNEQFSYSYQGNLQQIDHIFVSRSIYEAIESTGKMDWKEICAIPHINSPFCRNNHINFSDHDPDIVRLKGAFK